MMRYGKQLFDQGAHIADAVSEAHAQAIVDRDHSLRALTKIILDARANEDCDGRGSLGGYIFGDVMSEALESAISAVDR